MKSSSAEIGIGWDAKNLCFLASTQRWRELIQENKPHVDFARRTNYQIYMLLHSIFDGNTSIRARAKSLSSSIQKHVAEARKKGKAKEGCLHGMGDDDAYLPCYEDGTTVFKNKSSKRLACDVAISSQEGSRSSKSSKTSNKPFVEVATNVRQFCNLHIEEMEHYKRVEMKNAELEMKYLTLRQWKF